MEIASNQGSQDLAAQLAALVAPIQGAGEMLTNLSKGLSAAVGSAQGPAAGIQSNEVDGTGGSGAVAADSPGEVGVLGGLESGLNGFFSGLFESVNAQFGGLFSSLFGGGGEGGDGGLFGALGSLFSGKSDDEDKPKDEESGEQGSDPATGTEELKKADAELTEGKKKEDQDRIKSDTKVWGAYIGNAIAGSKKLAKIKKAAAVASVIVDTAKGIAKVFAEKGWPGGILPAALLAAQGAVQVSKIKGQAHDGIDNIPSTGTYLLERGERVVDSRLNTDLSGFLKAQRAGTSVNNSVENSNNSNNSVTNAPVINMTISGDASDDAISNNRTEIEGMIRSIYADYAMDSPFG